MSQKMSSAEAYAWNFLNDHMAKIARLRIADVAEIAHVSTATIVRTLKKQRYEGFSDFRNSIKNRNAPESTGFSSEANEVLYKTAEEVTRTINLMDVSDIDQMVRIMAQSKSICVLASGPTASVSEYFSNKLELSGKKCMCLNDKDYMVFRAKQMSENDLLIAISLRGETVEIVKAVQIAKGRGAKIITLTSQSASTLSRLADYRLLSYKSKLNKFDIDTDTASRIPLEISARVLLDMYAIHQKMGKIRADS